MNRLKINWGLWIQGLLFVAAAVLVFNAVVNIQAIMSTIGSFFSVISPVIMAAVIAYLLSRPCKWVEKGIRKVKEWIEKTGKYSIIVKFLAKSARLLSVLIVFIIAIWIIYAVLSFLFPILISNIIEFIDSVPDLYNEIEAFVMGIQWSDLDEMFNIQEAFEEFFADFDVQTVVGLATQYLGALTNFAISTAFWLFDFVLALIISIYMLLYKDVIFETVGRVANLMIRSENIRMLNYYIKQADDLFYKFIGAQFLDACIMGGLSIILLLLLNVRFAVFLGIFLGVANMIPKFGSIIASIVVIALTFITGDINQGILTAVLLTALQQFDGNVIGPIIMGDALKINPILVFFSLLVGAHYFGILGMFLSIPVAALANIIFTNIIEAKETMQLHSDQVASKVASEVVPERYKTRFRFKTKKSRST